MKRKLKIIKLPNGNFRIKSKTLIGWYETMFCTGEFENTTDCINHIHEKFDEDKCEIKYDKEW